VKNNNLIRDDGSLIFDCRPEEILALRKALGWTRRDLGYYLGAYLNPRDCYTVYRWEKGLAKPRRWFREQLRQLANYFAKDYISEIAKNEREEVDSREDS
jgi:transcriptional regulator with XRE-family HTH domain